MDITAASPPMLSPHFPRAHKKLGQYAHATTQQIVRLIHHLSSTQPGGIGFMWNNSLRSTLPSQVHSTMGPSTILNAPKCGSGAHRSTHLWQNFVTKSALEIAYNLLPSPPRTVDDILMTTSLGAWSTQDTSAMETSTRPPHSPSTLRHKSGLEPHHIARRTPNTGTPL